MRKFKLPKIKFPKRKLVKGISAHKRNKFKKAIRRKEMEIKSIDYSLYTGYKRIDDLINDIKKIGFNEESFRKILSMDLIYMEAKKLELGIEITNLKRYLIEKKI